MTPEISPRKRLLSLAGVGIATLACLEILARVVLSSAPIEAVWYDEAAQLKVAQMEARGQTDVVFAGTSMAWQAFDPAAFSAADPEHRTSYNAGLNGAVPGVTSRWILEEVVPRLDPQHVVWGLSSLDIAPEYGEPNVEAYDTAFMTDQRWLAGVDRWFSRHSDLVARRQTLRDPSRAFGTSADQAQNAWDLAANTLGADGQRRDFVERVDDRTRSIERSRLQGFWPEVGDVETIISTIDELRARGVEVTVVSLPIPDRYVELHPRGREDTHAVNLVIEQIGAATNSPVINLQNSMPDDSFVDFTHLGEVPAQTFTTRFTSQFNALDSQAQLASDHLRPAVADLVNAYELLADQLEGRPEGGQQSTSFFYNAEDLGRQRELARLRQEGLDVGTILIGTSQMRNAGDSTTMSESLDEIVVNLAMSGAGPEVWESYLPERLLEVAAPERVVWGVGALDLVGSGDDCTFFNGRDATLAGALALREAAFPWIRDIVDPATESQFGDPTLNLFLELPTASRSAAADYYDTWFGPLGDQTLNTERNIENDAADYPPQSVDFGVCERRVDLVVSATAALVDAGIEVVIVSMPTPQFRLDVYREDEVTIDAALSEFGELVTATGATYADLTRRLPDEEFRDYSHVDAEGAASFSSIIEALITDAT